MSLETSASESGEKYVNEFMFAGKMCLTDCGVENCAVRFVILLMKNVSKSSAVRVDEGGGGRGQRREENVLKSMRELRKLSIWSKYYVILAVETLAEKSERSDRIKLRSVGFCDLCHNLSAALSLERCLGRTTDSQGAEGVVRAGLEDKGQKVSKQDIRVEQKVSVALLASRYDNCLRGGNEDETIATGREGESEHKLRR